MEKNTWINELMANVIIDGQINKTFKNFLLLSKYHIILLSNIKKIYSDLTLI